MAMDGPRGIVTLVCLTCGKEKFFTHEVPAAVSCEQCGSTVFRTFATPTEPDEAACARWLLEKRWPNGFRCPACGHDEAWELFGAVEPGWARAQAVSDWVHENVSFQAGASTPTTTALDVWESRVGVCRDFAHLAVDAHTR